MTCCKKIIRAPGSTQTLAPKPSAPVTDVLVAGSSLTVKKSDGTSKTVELASDGVLPKSGINILNASGTVTVATVLTK